MRRRAVRSIAGRRRRSRGLLHNLAEDPIELRAPGLELVRADLAGHVDEALRLRGIVGLGLWLA